MGEVSRIIELENEVVALAELSKDLCLAIIAFEALCLHKELGDPNVAKCWRVVQRKRKKLWKKVV